jgi:hypothetical protein
MTPTTLAADAAQALQGVTEGPWAVHCDPCHYDTASDVKSNCGNLFAMVGGGAKWQEQEANARFIAFTRAWVPEAAAALDAKDAEIAALQAEVERMQELLDLGPLGRLGLTLRTRKALRSAGIKTLDKLRATDEVALLRIPNLGRKGLNDIRAALMAGEGGDGFYPHFRRARG